MTDFEVHPVGTAKRLVRSEEMTDLVKRLRKEYAEATVSTHNTLSTEPRYECVYCTCVEIAPNCHHEKCIALVFAESADRIEALEAALAGLSRHAPIMGSRGEYRQGQLDCLEMVREIARAALEDAE